MLSRIPSVDPEHSDNLENADDPVPEAVLNALRAMDLSQLYEVLNQRVPRRSSKYVEYKLDVARRRIASSPSCTRSAAR